MTKTQFLLILMFVLAVISFISKMIIRKNSKVKKEKKVFEDIKENEFNNYFTDISLDELKKKIFSNYTDIKSAISNFDYDRLRELCTDELFHFYTERMETIKNDNKQNIMKAFKNRQLNITRVFKEDNQLVVMVYLDLAYLNYYIDSTDESIISGDKVYDIEEGYILHFVYDSNSNNFLLKYEKKED